MNTTLKIIGGLVGATALLILMVVATIALFVFWPVGIVLWLIIIMGLNNKK